MKIIKIPFEAGALGKNKGCSQSPDKIIEELKKDTLNENNFWLKKEIISVAVDNNDFKKTHDSIFNEVKKLSSGVIIGGDHSVTYSSFKASGCDGIVILDAHPDLMPGTEMPSHEDFVRKLVEEGSVSPQNVIFLGLRSMHKSEIEFIEEKNIKFFSMKQVFEFGIKNVADTLMELSRKFNKLYLSLDIDIADPAFAPGTGYCEPGGMSSRELVYLIQRMKNLKNLKFFDVVEVNSSKDINNITASLAAKIIKEMGGVL